MPTTPGQSLPGQLRQVVRGGKSEDMVMRCRLRRVCLCAALAVH